MLALKKWSAVGLTHNKDSLATSLSNCGLLLHVGIVVMVNAGLTVLLETAVGGRVALATGLEGAAQLPDGLSGKMEGNGIEQCDVHADASQAAGSASEVHEVKARLPSFRKLAPRVAQ
eukprot:5322240-Pyramimonas_sp.AAC.1